MKDFCEFVMQHGASQQEAVQVILESLKRTLNAKRFSIC